MSNTMKMRIYKIVILPTVHSGCWFYRRNGEEFFAYLTTKCSANDKITPCFRVCDYDTEKGEMYPKSICLDVMPENCHILHEYTIYVHSNISIQTKVKKYKYEKQD